MNARMCFVGPAILATAIVCQPSAWSQKNQNSSQQEHTVTVRGRVLNKGTNEPIPRALVSTLGDAYATMTDDRGQFEITMVEFQEQLQSPGRGFAGSMSPSNQGTLGGVSRLGTFGLFHAKKPGFLENRHPAVARPDPNSPDSLETTIFLVPEALIIGQLVVADSDGDVRIQCELYHQQVRDGRATWQPAGVFTTWGHGEFRFSGLEAGTYRLITHEQMDRESLMLGPGSPLFGYPPVYYPNTTDFSAAAPIAVKAGETAQVNLTVARRQYYPVRIPVRNAPLAAARVSVYPMGHWGPGWSLGFNPMQRVIEGMLPDGHYTLELDTFGESAFSARENFAVNGAPLDAGPLFLTQDTSVTVSVRTEFQQATNAAQEESPANPTRQGMLHLSVFLQLLEPFASTGPTLTARPVEGTDYRTLNIPNVPPGQYHVTVGAYSSYVASLQSGEVDLLKQPLIVGTGEVPPIEVTLRNDGAEVSGTLEGISPVQGNSQQPSANIEQYWRVFLVPTARNVWQEPPWYRTWDGTFKIDNVPPGQYLAVAYEEGLRDLNLPFGEEAFLKSLEGQAQTIQVQAGEKLANLKVKVLAEQNGDSGAMP